MKEIKIFVSVFFFLFNDDASAPIDWGEKEKFVCASACARVLYSIYTQAHI